MVKSFPGYWPPQKPFSEERDRWVLWLPVLFGIGISIYFELKIEPPLWMGPLAVVMVALTGYVVNLINRDHGSGPAALAEDCWVADVVISVVPVRRACPARIGVIDRFDLWRDGGAAIWMKENSIRIETVNGARGERPWVPKRGKKKSRSGT